jgi:hypothetical protein
MPASREQRKERRDQDAETARLFHEGLTAPEIANRFGVQPPCIRRRLLKLGLWKSNSKDAQNGYQSGLLKKIRAAEVRAENAQTAEAFTRVDRTPCTFCGVRGDIPCKHKRAL